MRGESGGVNSDGNRRDDPGELVYHACISVPFGEGKESGYGHPHLWRQVHCCRALHPTRTLRLRNFHFKQHNQTATPRLVILTPWNPQSAQRRRQDAAQHTRQQHRSSVGCGLDSVTSRKAESILPESCCWVPACNRGAPS